jgi:hypothetical protein
MLLGSSLNSFQILTRITGNSNTDDFIQSCWLRRFSSTSGWDGAALHDGISKGTQYVTPMTDTKTWWERRPKDDIQLWGNDNSIYMQLNKGNLYIGDQIPKASGTHHDAKLSVDGKVLAKELYINIHSSNWADFVFEKDYPLMSLEDVEKYINEHKHLPNIPSGKELTSEEYNLNIADMQKRQMEKIEEIYLHLMAQNKEIAELKREIEALKINLQKK